MSSHCSYKESRYRNNISREKSRDRHYHDEDRHSSKPRRNHHDDRHENFRRSEIRRSDDRSRSKYASKERHVTKEHYTSSQEKLESDLRREQRLSEEEQERMLLKLKSEINLILDFDNEETGRKKYDSKKSWESKKEIIHWGQRKLFLSELWFLTLYGDLGKTVVYAGSAPGVHIPFLASLFPSHQFILIDPSEFTPKYVDGNFKAEIETDVNYVRNDNKIRIIQAYFDDEIAQKIADQHSDILFISDIRTAGRDEGQQELIEIMVRKDNLKQKDWINIMKPKKSLLKFRCPYPDRENGRENLVMFKGDIYLQPLSGPTSTETRLVPHDDLVDFEYDNVKYEDQLCFHNDEVRRKTYSQPIKTGEGFNEKWDVSAEIVILYDFLKKFPDFYPGYSMFEKITKLSKDISTYCSMSRRTLETKNQPHGVRRQFAYKNHKGFYNLSEEK